MVTNDIVEQTCAEVSDFTEEQLASEFERFFTVQPELCDFVVELTGESDPKIQELTLYLSYMVLKSVERSVPQQVSPVSQEGIEAAFRTSEGWIERMNRANTPAAQSEILSDLSVDLEPHLLQYVISEINQPMDDDSQLTDEQKGEVFFVLRTVITALAGEPS